MVYPFQSTRVFLFIDTWKSPHKERASQWKDKNLYPQKPTKPNDSWQF